MYNNQFYMQDLQNMKDRIDLQIKQMQQPQNQVMPQIQQTFQLSNPQNINDFDAKYVNSVEDVKKTITVKNTLFVNKDFSTLWFKDTSGVVRTFALSEIIELDEKDKEIQELKKEIEELKGVVLNGKSNDITNVDEQIATKQSTSISVNKPSKAK